MAALTMEGVARRIDPNHNIWAAADPVVRRYILSELSPPARVRRFAHDAGRIANAIARRLEDPPPTVVAAQPAVRVSRLLWFALGAALSALAFALGAWVF